MYMNSNTHIIYFNFCLIINKPHRTIRLHKALLCKYKHVLLSASNVYHQINVKFVNIISATSQISVEYATFVLLLKHEFNGYVLYNLTSSHVSLSGFGDSILGFQNIAIVNHNKSQGLQVTH